MRNAPAIYMPPIKLAVALLLLGSMPAAAERTGGSSGGKGGGGSGPLGQVSSGIGAASGAGTPSHPTSGTSSNYVEDAIDRPDCVRTVEGRVVQGRVVDGRLDCPHGYVMVTNERNPILGSTVAERSAPSSEVDLYLGAQKVQDSDGSLAVGLAITDYRFRVAGTFSHYFEGESDGSRVTMTLPTLTAGLRIDNFGRTKMILEGGVAYVRTKGDPMANSSITGAIVGVQVEHAVSPKLTIVGLAQHMAFPDKIRAESGLVGVRYGMVQAALRVLDFNVGPALYGPEVGVSF